MNTDHGFFRRDVEGLRALAVLLVLLYHAGLGLSGGYVGVDVFLVLSGFLITSLLLREAESGRISLREFWARRARRLLAASTTVLVATVAFGFLLLEPSRLAGLAADAVAAGTFSSNIRFALTNSDYLSGLALPSPLLHFWSLALEEQFYLIWPVLVALTLRVRRFRTVLLTLLGTLLVASLVVSVLTSDSSPSFAYYLLPTRAWELLVGAALAFLPASSFQARGRLSFALRSIAGVLGVLGVIYAAWSFDHETVFPGSAALLPVLATALVLWAGPGALVGRLLSARPLGWVGARSYSIYLWHWPLFVIFESRFGLLGTNEAVALVLVSLLLADLTYRFVENPVRRSALLSLMPSRSLGFGAALASVSVVLGLFLGNLAPASSTVTLTANAGTSVVTDPVIDATSLPVAETAVPVEGANISDAASSPVTTPATTQPPVLPVGRTLLIGDSTLAPLRWFESGLTGLSGFDYVLDAESCRRISLSSCKGREDRTPRSVVPVLDALTEAGDRFDTVVLMGGYHAYEDSILKEFRSFVEAARRHGVSRIVVLDWRESLAFPVAGSRGKVSVYTRFNEIIRQELSSGSYKDVTLLGWHAFTATHPEWFRSDGIHTNLAGTVVLGEFISGSLAAIEGRPCPRQGGSSPCQVPVVAPSRDVLAEYGLADTDRHCYEYGSARTPGCRRDKLA
jgi:peptidoglycan/LPS O-acetylase OafA/YrhL